MSPPRVHVGPDPDRAIEAAVRAGGGRLAGPDEAEAVVWLGSPEGIAEVLRPAVRWVQLPSAGVERWLASGVIDVERTWTSAAGAYAPSVAEHALTLILAARRRIPECARARAWDPDLHGAALEGSTVTIVGAGGIGRALLALLAPFGVEAIAVTRSGREVEGAALSIASDRLAGFLGRTDVLVIAAPSTPETRRMVGEEALRALPSHACIVNVARGSLVDHDALVRALREGWIASAALDVTDPEPLPVDHPLWELPNALITPHVANPPDALAPRLAGRVTENVRRFAEGGELIGRIDPAGGY